MVQLSNTPAVSEVAKGAEQRLQAALTALKTLSSVLRWPVEGCGNTPPVHGHLNELIVATAPWHPWAHSQRAISLEELAETPLVVREQGSGTRDGLDKLLRGHHLAHPTQILASNTAVRVAVTAGAGPAVLSRLTIQAQLAAGQLVHIPLQAPAITRPLTAIWVGPHRPVGPATELLRIATHMPCTANDIG